ncbi:MULTISPECIES: hypothetical protein [Streptomyces]|uniref:hypothetical protein n=1 Tax=Streptomyces TaxID=1883 RepID=UPI00073DBF55|nr:MULTISPECIES: hypothetical protein [unclassified Streptomyces]MYU29092.1 hypothetical protein [Streptomyces sp. SID7810]OYP16207.1 hypothetical protein CFC35_18220 [Streptomyces sp. FBKL.4005]BCM68496.1 hypothetical protein EASAB2608_03830 [Streptomyces sp. EAS-AB2608]CUW30146.1 hypothetical protein TUE45_04866 [Streptomyces reticuli]
MPHPEQPSALPALTDTEAAAEARRIIADAYRPTPEMPIAYRDDTPLPTYGSTPPVVQPGTPPMSQRAVDAGRLMLTGGLATVPPGLVAIGLLIASEHADPTVIGMVCAAPAAVAVPVLAIARLLRRASGVVPDVHHHHYTGPVRQEHTTTHTRGLIARTHNDHR